MPNIQTIPQNDKGNPALALPRRRMGKPTPTALDGLHTSETIH